MFYPLAMIIRKATRSDSLDVLAWRNDPLTRAMSRSPEEIAKAAHLAWFDKALRSPRLTLLIGEQDGRKVGMVRFDHGEQTEVSINLNPACRGERLGSALLAEALKSVGGDLTAEVKGENLASRRLFEDAGFAFRSVREGLRQYVLRRS